MKHTLLVILLAICLISQLFSITYYVTPGGTGPGLSWQHSSGDLAAILFLTQSGDEVWVAKGTYKPTQDKSRSKSFIIPPGVKVLGGFEGNETAVSQRNFIKNKTTLSGNIGLQNDFSDNSFTVVLIIGCAENTILDGFTIADGSADGAGASGTKERGGAGLYIDGSGAGSVSKPVIRNCNFINNYSRDGGAVYINARNGYSSPFFQNCLFASNRSDLDGGAVFNDGRHGGKANPTFIDCVFEGNQGNYGGAVCNYGGRGESSPVFQNCTFSRNEAYLRGGAIYNMDIEGRTAPVINNCRFVNNIAVAGQGIYTFSKPETRVETRPTNYRMN